MAREPTSGNEAFEFSVRTVLSSLRMSFDSLHRAQRRRSNSIDVTRLKSAILALESVRLAIPLLPFEGRRPAMERQDLLLLLEELRDLTANADFAEYGRSLRFHLLSRPPRERDRFVFNASLFENRTAIEATNNLIELIEVELGLSRAEKVQLELLDLRRVVPDQKIAPVQFFFRGDRIAVLQRKSKPDEEDLPNVVAAKEQLHASGDRILEELARSNCDKRLIESVKYLQEQLSIDGNIVQIGLSNITCEAMCHAFQAELPDAVAAMLTAHTRGVELYIGQFPEWHRFVENAASSQLDQSDISILRQVASGLITDLEAKPDLAEPEVPQTIKRINELLKTPGKSAKRAAFAMLRTLENLISNVFSHSVEFLEMTVSKTKQKSSAMLAHAAAVVLLTIVLNSAASLAPIASKVSEAQWLKTAITIVERQLQRLAD